MYNRRSQQFSLKASKRLIQAIIFLVSFNGNYSPQNNACLLLYTPQLILPPEGVLQQVCILCFVQLPSKILNGAKYICIRLRPFATSKFHDYSPIVLEYIPKAILLRAITCTMLKMKILNYREPDKMELNFFCEFERSSV